MVSNYKGSKEKTNMVVIEVELPSGFQPKEDSLDEMSKKLVKLVEYNDKTNSVAMYFDEMPKNRTCINFEIEQILPVESIQPAIAEIYDYYDQTDVFSVEYTF